MYPVLTQMIGTGIKMWHAQATTPFPNKLYLPMVAKPPEPQTGPDIYTTSYYMNTIDPAAAYTLGCKLGQRDKSLPGMQDNMVILDYGTPRFVNNFYGTKLFLGQNYHRPIRSRHRSKVLEKVIISAPIPIHSLM